MKRFLSQLHLATFGVLMLAVLLLSGCSSPETDTDGGGLESMFDSDSDTTVDETGEPEEVPYVEGPAEIPSDLVPNE